ncbi:MAG: hypothetical protein ACKO42_07240 [Gammaproteobacteria bacterium]
MTATFSKRCSRASTVLRKVFKIRADQLLLVSLSAGVLCGGAQAEPSRQGWVIDTEAYATWQGRNDVQVPNDSSGSRFSLDGLTGDGPYVAPRVQFSWPAGDRREWRVLLAPLALSRDGLSASAIRFQGATFTPGAINARYQFNSWRGTVRWRWIDREDLVVKVGFTAKIRDASIRLRQGARSAEKENTGFVPLLHGAFERPLGSGWRLEGDIDALAGGPGYAVDAGLKLMKPINDEWSVGASLRYLDGGADNDEVYAFASFTSAGISLRWRPRESGAR